MTKEQLDKAARISCKIERLKTNNRDLRECNHTLGITHWSNCSISYCTYIEVSQDIINAIIAENESKIEQLQIEFNAL